MSKWIAHFQFCNFKQTFKKSGKTKISLSIYIPTDISGFWAVNSEQLACLRMSSLGSWWDDDKKEVEIES